MNVREGGWEGEREGVNSECACERVRVSVSVWVIVQGTQLQKGREIVISTTTYPTHLQCQPGSDWQETCIDLAECARHIPIRGR